MQGDGHSVSPDEYAMLYAVPRDDVMHAAPDWTTIGRLLDQSYAELHHAVGRRASA